MAVEAQERPDARDRHEIARAAMESGLFHPSKAAVAHHAIHPILIPFPIAFLVGAVLTDVVAQLSDAAFWPDASIWLLWAGLATGLVASAVGLWDFVGIAKARSHGIGWVHSLGNGLVLALAAGNAVLRLGDPAGAIVPWGITLSAAAAVALGITGWAGGELSYRHGIGVAPHEVTARPRG